MKEQFFDKKLDIISSILLITSFLLLPTVPVQAEKCPRFTEEQCYNETELRPAIEALEQGLTYRAEEAGEPIERNRVTYRHSPLTHFLGLLIALSPLSFRLKKELQSRV